LRGLTSLFNANAIPAIDHAGIRISIPEKSARQHGWY
jgi:hypothetical protein